MTLEELKDVVQAAERAERERRGLPVGDVTDRTEFPFVFATEAVAAFARMMESWRKREPNSAEAAFYCAEAALAAKDYTRANKMMALAQSLDPANPKLRMRFGHVPAPASISLPAVSGEYPRDAAFFMSCDQAYFTALCRPLLMSMAHHSPGVRCHVHLIDADPAVTTLVKKFPLELSFTYEESGLRSAPDQQRWNYYGAIRYVRFAEALDHCGGPLWIADADGLVTGDVRPLLRLPMSLALRVTPGALDPWHQIPAALVAGNDAARPYFRRVADILKSDFAHQWWGMDQYALFSALLGVKTELSFLTPQTASHNDVPGLFWFITGSRKLALATAETEYAQLHRKYLHEALALES